MTLEVTERDAILGVRPSAVYAPATLDDCAEVMAQAARDRLRLGFIGGGTALGLGAPPTGLDAVIRTERLARIVEHAPADMVVLVEAGVTVAALQAALAPHGQRLALDPPAPERATLGGVIAAAGFGPLRARYGAVRDLIIGVTLVLADGTVARGGGKVVKNVAGFDLPKVACGSLGTLGMIAAAAFRLHPLPEAVQTVAIAGVSPAQVVALTAAVRDAQLEPTCAVALGTTGESSCDLALRFEGFRQGIAPQVARCEQLARSAGVRAAVLADGEAAAFWRRHDAVRTGASDEQRAQLRLGVHALPSRFPDIAPRLAALGEFAWYATLGLGFVTGAAPDAGAVSTARAALTTADGWLVIHDAPAALRGAVDPWGPVPGSFAVMRQLKHRFDPDRRLNPGRYVGGL